MDMNESLETNSYFRDSPWLPSTRKIADNKESVELMAVTKTGVNVKKDCSVKITNLCASWAADENKLVLQDINFKTNQVSDHGTRTKIITTTIN